MKTHPDLACDRAYAVSGKNKLIALYLSTLACAKLVISCYFISGLNPDRGFPVMISPRAQLMQNSTTPGHPDRRV